MQGPAASTATNGSEAVVCWVDTATAAFVAALADAHAVAVLIAAK